MTCSMTAFARQDGNFEGTAFCWEIKSVNHRYLEASFRLPEAFRCIEIKLRNLLQSCLSRGKIECCLKISEQCMSVPAIHVNQPFIDALLETGIKIAADKNLQNDLTLSNLLAWPGVVSILPPDDELFFNTVIEAFKNALDLLHKSRRTEGLALTEIIGLKLSRLVESIAEATSMLDELQTDLRSRLKIRLEELDIHVDSPRMEQEIAMLLLKLDVREELDRLTSHCVEVSRVLQSEEPAGRRLDFLMQELNREANTLTSKSDSVVLTRCAVDMKVLIEQMREQIQNIE